MSTTSTPTRPRLKERYLTEVRTRLALYEHRATHGDERLRLRLWLRHPVRTWRAWYAHVTLSMLALAWLAATRARAAEGERAPATRV